MYSMTPAKSLLYHAALCPDCQSLLLIDVLAKRVLWAYIAAEFKNLLELQNCVKTFENYVFHSVQEIYIAK